MTLFDEIAGSRPSPAADVREEVRTHLLRICATRRGSLWVAPDYGVDDPTHLFHSFPGGLDDWLGRLASSIRRYEPRLRDVRVTAQPPEELNFTLRFDIHGTLVWRGRADSSRFTASVDPTHAWSMR